MRAVVPVVARWLLARTPTRRTWRRCGGEPEYLGYILLMLIRGEDVEVVAAVPCRSEVRGETRTIELPRPIEVQPGWQQGDISLWSRHRRHRVARRLGGSD